MIPKSNDLKNICGSETPVVLFEKDFGIIFTLGARNPHSSLLIISRKNKKVDGRKVYETISKTLQKKKVAALHTNQVTADLKPECFATKITA